MIIGTVNDRVDNSIERQHQACLQLWLRDFGYVKAAWFMNYNILEINIVLGKC